MKLCQLTHIISDKIFRKCFAWFGRLVLNPINLPTYYMLSKTNYDKIVVSYSFEGEH